MKQRMVFIGVWMMGYMGGIALTGWIESCPLEQKIGPGFLLVLFPFIFYLTLIKWEMAE